jgi:diazepam-binding inhibitor (GABA receptor modulating acyl-CoA-binding protein)
MADPQADFDTAVANSKKLSQRPDNATLLKLYGLYKQATMGDVTEKKPGFSDLIGRAKWDAWNGLKGTSGEDARRQYVELVQSLG